MPSALPLVCSMACPRQSSRACLRQRQLCGLFLLRESRGGRRSSLKFKVKQGYPRKHKKQRARADQRQFGAGLPRRMKAEGWRRGFVFQNRKQLVDCAPLCFAPRLAGLPPIKVTGAKQTANLTRIQRAVQAPRFYVVEIHQSYKSRMDADSGPEACPTIADFSPAISERSRSLRAFILPYGGPLS
jgi:hypothetical protein